MMRKLNIRTMICLLCVILLVLSSCSGGRMDGTYYAENRTFAGYNLAEALGISFDNTLIDMTEPEGNAGPAVIVPDENAPNESNAPTEFTMRVYDKLEL